MGLLLDVVVRESAAVFERDDLPVRFLTKICMPEGDAGRDGGSTPSGCCSQRVRRLPVVEVERRLLLGVVVRES